MLSAIAPFAFRLLKPLLRHGLQAAGGTLATYGIIEGHQVESFVGIGITAATALWMSMDVKKAVKAGK